MFPIGFVRDILVLFALLGPTAWVFDLLTG